MSSRKPPTSGSSVSRRSFFRQIFVQGVEKLEESGQELANRFVQVGQLLNDDPSPSAARQPEVRFLRPPGALPEILFQDACTKCGDCVNVCPAKCIQIDTREDGPAIGGGYPYIIPRESPCVVCDDFSCMKACPTNALQLAHRAEYFDMGIAAINSQTCLRSHPGDEQDCSVCVDHCPLGESALRIDPDHAFLEVGVDCNGCGVCENVCPTQPASIWVEPAE